MISPYGIVFAVLISAHAVKRLRTGISSFDTKTQKRWAETNRSFKTFAFASWWSCLSYFSSF